MFEHFQKVIDMHISNVSIPTMQSLEAINLKESITQSTCSTLHEDTHPEFTLFSQAKN
jgi:hypothetical protein